MPETGFGLCWESFRIFESRRALKARRAVFSAEDQVMSLSLCPWSRGMDSGVCSGWGCAGAAEFVPATLFPMEIPSTDSPPPLPTSCVGPRVEG